MILFDIINQLVLVIAHTLAYLPSLTTLPFGMTDAMLYGANIWYGFLDVFWPLQIVWLCVLWYAGFKVVMITLKLFLGARAPNV